MVVTSILRKVIKVIETTENREQMLSTKKYINLYYKLHGTKNKWIIQSYLKKHKDKVGIN
jgi:hypothetical protein